MGQVVVVDGEVFAPEEAKVSIFDRGFLFGDSVYEVVRTRRGRPFLLEPHLERLRRSAREIYMELPFADEDLARDVEEAVAAADNPETYVRIVVTRGSGEVELHPGSADRPTTVLLAKPLVLPPEELYRDGAKIAIVPRRRTDPLSLNPAAKTGNYLNNVLAIIEARSRGAYDAVMLNAEGRLTEGTTSNVFLVEEGVVRTPALASGILEGITRGFVMDLLEEEGIEVEEAELAPERLRSAPEAFITSTTRDVMPIGWVDDRRLADEVPGPVTRVLMDRFAAL